MASTKRERQRQNRNGQQLVGAGRTLADAWEDATGAHPRPVVEAVRGDLVPVGEARIRRDGTMPVRLISPGWGSSGYYAAEVLEQAATDRIFPAGTHMYIDHPTLSERSERPERSIRDLAAVLETDGIWQANHPDGPGIYAQAKVFGPYREPIAEMAEHIGVSIRASAEVSRGEAEGRRGTIVERIVEAPSVDFVTRAGRGGQVLAILESAHVTEAMADDVRQWLRDALRDRFGEGDDRWVWVRDYDADAGTVIFDLEGDGVDDPGTYQLAYTLTDDTITLADDEPTKVRVTTSYEPVTTETPINETKEDGDMPLNEDDKKAVSDLIAEALKPITDTLAALAEAAKPPAGDGQEETVEESEREVELREQLLRRDAADHIRENDRVAKLPAAARKRIVEAVSPAATRTDAGDLDTEALDEAIGTAIKAELDYLAEATGSPVRGVGGDDPSGITEGKVSTDDLAEAFQRLGMTESGAKIAATGRA